MCSAKVFGSRLGAVDAAELRDPVLRLWWVRAVPAGVGSVEQVDVPDVLAEAEGVVVGVHEVAVGVPVMAGAGVGDGVGGLGHVGLVAVELGYPYDIAAQPGIADSPPRLRAASGLDVVAPAGVGPVAHEDMSRHRPPLADSARGSGRGFSKGLLGVLTGQQPDEPAVGSRDREIR